MSTIEEFSVVSKKKNVPQKSETGFEHQNWDTVTISKTTKNKVSNDSKKNINPESIRLAKLDNNEIVKAKSLSTEAKQELIKARVAKGLNQEKLANALSMQANLYKDIENGKSIPNQNMLNKINNFLGTKVKLT